MAQPSHAILVAIIAASASVGTILIQGLGKVVWRRFTRAAGREAVADFSTISNTLVAMKANGVSPAEIEQLRDSIIGKTRVQESAPLTQTFNPKAVAVGAAVQDSSAELLNFLGGEALTRSEQLLGERVAALEGMMGETELALFRAAYSKWREYRELQTKSTSIGYSSVAGSRMAQAIEKDILTRDKLVDVETEIKKRKSATPGPSPRLNWMAQVGHQGWRSNYTLCGETIIATTCGEVWNEPDEFDGVSCVNRLSGIELWRFKTGADANEGMIIGGIFCFGCDDGALYALRATDGRQLWKREFKSAVLTRPEPLPLPLGGRDLNSAKRSGFSPVVCATYDGQVLVIDARTGVTVSEIQLPAKIASNLVVHSRFGLPVIYVPCVGGRIFSLSYDDLSGKLARGQDTLIEYPCIYSPKGRQPADILGTPLPHGDQLLVPVGRATTYDYPPIAILSADLQEIAWFPSGGEHATFGNIRTNPILLGDELIIASSYASGVYGLSLETGVVSWEVELGETVFQQWSSPVVADGSIYVGRIDGFLYKIDQVTKELEWSLFLGDSATAGSVSFSAPSRNTSKMSGIWSSPIGAAILATPLVYRDVLYVGSAEGFLYCVGIPAITPGPPASNSRQH